MHKKEEAMKDFLIGVLATIGILVLLMGVNVVRDVDQIKDTLNEIREESLLSGLGDEVRDGIVVLLDQEEVCVVLSGEKDVSCIEREKMLRITESLDGPDPTPPRVGETFRIEKDTYLGEEIVLFSETT